MKKYLARVMALVLALSCMAGCGSEPAPTETNNATEAATTEAAQAEKVKLTWQYGEPQFVEQYEAVAKAFNESQDAIEVEAVLLEDAAVMKTKINSGEMEDLFMYHTYNECNTYREHLVDLSGEAFADKILEKCRPAGETKDGVLVGVPVDNGTYGIVYNKVMFEEAGITELPRTYDDMRAVCEKLQAAGFVPFATGFKDSWIMGHTFAQFMAAERGTLADYESIAKGEETFADIQNMDALYDHYDLMAEFSIGNDFDWGWQEIETAFANGEVAMFQMGDWCEAFLLDLNPDLQLGLMPIPVRDGSAYGIASDMSWNIGIYSKSEHIEEAKQFLNFVVTSDAGKNFAASMLKIGAYEGCAAPDCQLGAQGAEFVARGESNKWIFQQWPTGFYEEAYAIMQGYAAGQYSREDATALVTDAYVNFAAAQADAQ